VAESQDMGGGDAPDAPAEETCSAGDISTWGAFHSAAGLGQAIRRCAITTACVEPPCDVGACLGAVAGVGGCTTCVELESDCAVSWCESACFRGTNDECRACLCDSACERAFAECAETSLAVCDGVHGRDATPEEALLDGPILIQRKARTGFTIASAILGTNLSLSELSRGYTATGWSELASLPVGGVEFVAEFMGGCERDTCPFRLSPLLADGRVGQPAVSAAWDAGWDTFASYRDGSATFWLTYKSGVAPVTGATAGSWRLYRLEAGADPLAPAMLEVGNGSWLDAEQQPYRHILALAVDGVPRLLAIDSSFSEVHAMRPTVTGNTVNFTDTLVLGSWGEGWDLAETFRVGDRWFLIQYDDGRPALTEAWARVTEWTSDAPGSIRVTERVATTAWPVGYSRLTAFRASGGLHLYWQNLEMGGWGAVTLGSDPDAWPEGFATFSSTRPQSVDSPWNVVAIFNAGLWGDAP
jgi:hypothetical protein